MEKHKQIKLYLKKDIINEIEEILKFREVRDILQEENNRHVSIEEFIIGCTCFYLRQLRTIDDLADIRNLGKPFQLKNRIGELLEKKGWSQKDLVEKTGINAGNINNILKNKNQPSLDYFFRIWIALNCPPLSEILYREEEK
jgi:DNA-binding Xre family transcriptional regulator